MLSIQMQPCGCFQHCHRMSNTLQSEQKRYSAWQTHHHQHIRALLWQAQAAHFAVPRRPAMQIPPSRLSTAPKSRACLMYSCPTTYASKSTTWTGSCLIVHPSWPLAQSVRVQGPPARNNTMDSGNVRCSLTLTSVLSKPSPGGGGLDACSMFIAARARSASGTHGIRHLERSYSARDCRVCSTTACARFFPSFPTVFGVRGACEPELDPRKCRAIQHKMQHDLACSKTLLAFQMACIPSIGSRRAVSASSVTAAALCRQRCCRRQRGQPLHLCFVASVKCADCNWTRLTAGLCSL